MLRKKLLFITLTTASIALVSCGGEKVEVVKDYQETTDTLSTAVRAAMMTSRAGIPSPVLVAKQLAKSGYSFNKGILNSTSKASSYSGKYAAAANLGVYGADFGYVAGYGQSQDVLDYLSQVGKLAKTVGVESAFSEDFGKTLNANLGKEDSLTDAIESAYSKAERNLQSQDRVNAAALIVAGGWVEGLYIGAQTVGAKPKDPKTTEAYHCVYSQLYSYQYVVELLSALKKDADCKKMLDDLTTIGSVMETYKTKPKLEEADIVKIKEAITPLRTKITG